MQMPTKGEIDALVTPEDITVARRLDGESSPRTNRQPPEDDTEEGLLDTTTRRVYWL